MQNRCPPMCMGILTVLLVGGCATAWKPVDQPGISVENVRISQQTDQGVRVEVTVRLSNPNPIALPLVYASYGVALDGLGRFELADQTHRTLPARGSQVVVLPAAFAWPQGSPAVQGYAVWGSVQYEPPGQLRKVLTETGIPLPSAAFSQRGSFE